MTKLFVSYSRFDQETVQMLVDDIKALGNEVWYDDTLTGGQRWWDNILLNIRECDIFLFAASPDSLESEACKSELGYADKLGKAILPLSISTKVNKSLLPHLLSEIHVTDYHRQDKESAFGLARAINGAQASAPLPDSLPVPPAVPVSYLSTLKEQIESAETLSYKEQISLVFQLKAGLTDGRSLNEIHTLLECLKQRNDLLAKVAVEIDAVLDEVKKRLVVTTDRTNTASSRPSKLSTKPGETVDNAIQRQESIVKIPNKCQGCGRENDLEARFCSGCGSPLVASKDSQTFSKQPVSVTGTKDLEDNNPQKKIFKSRMYSCQNDESDKLISELTAWLENQNFNCQNIPLKPSETLLQVAQRGSWRKLVGMETALNVLFRQKDALLIVEIGAGNWVDKATVGAVSLFVLWPLAVTASIGAWQQLKLPDRIFDFIGAKLPNSLGEYVTP